MLKSGLKEHKTESKVRKTIDTNSILNTTRSNNTVSKHRGQNMGLDLIDIL